MPGRRVCLATAAVSLWHLLSAPRVPLCVCFVFLPLDSAWLYRRRAPIYACFAYVWWNVLRVLVMFCIFIYHNFYIEYCDGDDILVFVLKIE